VLFGFSKVDFLLANSGLSVPTKEHEKIELYVLFLEI
jgi:hypothetical protein